VTDPSGGPDERVNLPELLEYAEVPPCASVAAMAGRNWEFGATEAEGLISRAGRTSARRTAKDRGDLDSDQVESDDVGAAASVRPSADWARTDPPLRTVAAAADPAAW
jgi:hypothetical protein